MFQNKILTLSIFLVLLFSVFLQYSACQPVTTVLVLSEKKIKPGDYVEAKLYISNHGDEDLRTDYIDIEIYLLIPLINYKFSIYSYKDVWKQVISPGDTDVHRKRIVVPFYTPPGEYTVKLSVISNQQKVSNELQLEVEVGDFYYLLALVILLLIILGFYLKIKAARVRWRVRGMEAPEVRSEVVKLVKEHRKVSDALNKLEKDHEEGKVSEAVYSKLKEEYTNKVSSLESKMGEERVRVENELEKLSTKLNELNLKLEEIETRHKTGTLPSSEYKKLSEALKKDIRRVRERYEARQKEKDVLSRSED